MKNWMKSWLLLLALLPSSFWAQVSLPNVFSDNMVLQQGKKVNVWGQAAPGERVAVKFGKQTQKTVADDKGDWSVQLDEMAANAKPQRMTVRGNKNKVVFDNVLVGEVWLASGQSNMEYSMNNHSKYAKPQRGDRDYQLKAYREAKNPNIRVMYVRKELKCDTLPTDGWKTLDEESLKPVSAAAYFFAEKLEKELGVPVGVISTSWGGTTIETWTPEQAYSDSPVFASQIKEGFLNGRKVGERYEKMLLPIVPYTLKGFLWYQGETNLINGDMENYAYKKEVMINWWRKMWQDEKLPFYYVQLAPYAYTARKTDLLAKAWDALPRFWEVQTSCLKVPYTGMVVTNDLVDSVRDIHPSYKWVVGERLARLALAKDYGKDIVCCGPSYKSMKVDGNRIILEFDNADSGLVTRDGKAPDWFYVRTTKERYLKAEAKIEGNKIILEHELLYHPVSVHFAWDESAMPNLMNKEGLPASSFRVDE